MIKIVPKIKEFVYNQLKKRNYIIRKANLNDIQTYYKLYDKKDVNDRKFYNIGAGVFKHPAWTNIDHYSEYYSNNLTDLDIDLMKCTEFPIESNSGYAVYCAHTVEHISDQAAQNMMNESYRLLKEGGVIRIVTDNIDLYYETLLNGDIEFWRKQIDNYSNSDEMKRIGLKIPMNKASLKQIFLYSFASQLSTIDNGNSANKIDDKEFDRIFSSMEKEKALDYCKNKIDLSLQGKYPGHHINWYNENKLRKMLHEAGFRNIYRSGYGQSMCHVMRNTDYFDNHGEHIAIFMEARK